MRVVADLHLHSKYARATSPQMDIENLSKYAKIKGLNILGTGDFTHPTYLKDLKKKLEPIENSGLYNYNGTSFMLTTEVATFYFQNNKSRRVHHLVHVTSLEIVDQIIDVLTKRGGNTGIDGRMMIKMSSPELVELLIGISKDVEVVPAHLWTPFFGCLGSKTGFDSVKDCYLDQTKNIHAVETGLSSDPPLNWRLSQLDDFALMSNSDSHSPWPWRLGREANVFDLKKVTYWELWDAVRKKDKERFLYTIETSPEYGKYHNNGHRNCNVNITPEETKRINSICPKCVKGNTIIIGDNKPISQISHNDRCLGMSSYGKVKKTFVRPFKGNIIKIDASGTLPIETTPEHPILIVTSKTKNGAISFFSEPYWKEAKNIVPKHGHKDGDYVILPRINGVIDIKEIDLRQFTTKHGINVTSGKHLPLSFPLNKETAWLLGLYVAEGSSSTEHIKNASPIGAIRFSLGKHEKELQRKVYKIGKSLGYSPCFVRKKNVTEIVISSMLLNKAFSSWCAKGAPNKKVPDFILLHKDMSLIKAFLDGYMAGDGCIYRGTVQAETVSKLLALHLQILYARLGIFLHVKCYRPREELFQGRKVNRLDRYVMYYSNKSQAKIFRKFIATPIRKLDVAFYEGKVYNLETDDNTYLVSNSVVHNCGKQLTIGVLQRVEELADRPEGFVPKDAIQFKSLLPLYEIVSNVLGIKQLYSQRVSGKQDKLIEVFGNELNVLLNASKEEMIKHTSEEIANAVIAVRESKIWYIAGYDGVYGIPVFSEQEYKRLREQQKIKVREQKSLKDFKGS